MYEWLDRVCCGEAKSNEVISLEKEVARLNNLCESLKDENKELLLAIKDLENDLMHSRDYANQLNYELMDAQNDR